MKQQYLFREEYGFSLGEELCSDEREAANIANDFSEEHDCDIKYYVMSNEGEWEYIDTVKRAPRVEWDYTGTLAKIERSKGV